MLIDSSDREVLAAHRARRPYPIASTTKLMTAYVARRELRLDELVKAPVYTPSSSAESLLGLQAGERISVRDLLYGLLLASGNDAAVTLADATAGSTSAFVAQMNATARRLGLRHTHYANPIGLDDPENYSSAADLGELATRLRRDRFLRKVVDTPEKVLTTGAVTRDVVNRNNLVRTIPWVNGVKTGYTLGAGNVLVASGSRHGVDLVSAVLGAPSEAARDSESVALLDYGRSLYHRRTPVAAGERLATPAIRYQDGTLALRAAHALAATVRRGERLGVTVDAPAEVEGPIARGERLGSATLRLEGRPVGRTALRAGAAIGEADLADRIDDAVPGPRALVWAVAIVALALAALVGVRLLTHRPPTR